MPAQISPRSRFTNRLASKSSKKLAGLILSAVVATTLLFQGMNMLTADEKKPAETKPAEKETKPAEKKPTDTKPEKPADDKKPETKTEPAKPKPDDKDKKEPAQPAETALKPMVLAINLENPSGLAIHETTGDVFIASRYGVYRYKPEPKPHTMNLEIDAYPVDVYGKGPMYNIGPLGLSFLDKDHLVVSDGSRKDAEELVRVYKINEKPNDPYVKEDSALYTLGPIKAGDQSEKGEGNFFGVAVGASSIFVSCNGDDTKGWIARSEVKDGKPGELKLYIATKEAVKVDAPTALTFSPDGKQLVVAQMGEINDPPDSLLTMYNPADGKLIKKYETGLSDIVGLAYSPKTKKLYATDFAWADSTKGGLFELTIDGDKVTAKKLLPLDKPVALAFDKEGALYLTLFGTADKNAKDDKEAQSPGKLLKIKPGL